ncbi:MAG: choice-of-anchor Q domain-containing protein [Candidatus Promineifilaceae bacterium]
MRNKIQSLFVSLFLPFVALGTLFLVFLLYLPTRADGGSYIVNAIEDTNDGTCNVANCTLREAILAANETPEADTIIFSLPPSSTIVLNGTQLPPITGTVKIDGSTADNLTISGNNISRVFVVGQLPPPYPRPSEKLDEIRAGVTVTINNLTIVAANDGYGSAISNDGTLFVINSDFENLTSAYGGIYNEGILKIEGSSFNNNVANAAGGAIFNNYFGTLKISNSYFNNNSASGPYSDGGSIYNRGMLTITNSIFNGNSVAPSIGLGNGGAIWSVTNGRLTIQNSSFISNSSNYYGGAILSSSFRLTITNSSFAGNSAGTGGAVVAYKKTYITGSTFKGNSAEFDGGGIYTGGSTDVVNSTFNENNAGSDGGGIFNSTYATILNSTISGNLANSGGGIRNNGTLNFINTIIANSDEGGDCVNTGIININVNNLVEDGTCNPAITGDPLLGPLQDNGGDTRTHALLPGSPAIDNGDPDTCAAPPVNNLDQRGESRPKDGDGDGVVICDIGSFEVRIPDFSLAKSGTAIVAAGDFVTYTLAAVNNLTTTVTNIVLTDTIPTNATYISGGTLVGNVVSWTLPSLAVGEAFTRSFIVTATQTITNDDYRVSAAGGYSTTGSVSVVTIVVEPITGLSATNDSPTTFGDTTNLMASVASGDDVTYDWAFGDGQTGSGANVAHIYPGIDVYTAVVTATNSVSTVTTSTVVTIEQSTWTNYLPAVLGQTGNIYQTPPLSPLNLKKKLR